MAIRLYDDAEQAGAIVVIGRPGRKLARAPTGQGLAFAVSNRGNAAAAITLMDELEPQAMAGWVDPLSRENVGASLADVAAHFGNIKAVVYTAGPKSRDQAHCRIYSVGVERRTHSGCHGTLYAVSSRDSVSAGFTRDDHHALNSGYEKTSATKSAVGRAQSFNRDFGKEDCPRRGALWNPHQCHRCQPDRRWAGRRVAGRTSFLTRCTARAGCNTAEPREHDPRCRKYHALPRFAAGIFCDRSSHPHRWRQPCLTKILILE